MESHGKQGFITSMITNQSLTFTWRFIPHKRFCSCEWSMTSSSSFAKWGKMFKHISGYESDERKECCDSLWKDNDLLFLENTSISRASMAVHTLYCYHTFSLLSLCWAQGLLTYLIHRTTYWLNQCLCSHAPLWSSLVTFSGVTMFNGHASIKHQLIAGETWISNTCDTSDWCQKRMNE